jgi:membrane protein DedA with SNARE-associated domain
LDTTGLGAPLALALLVPMEAGIPIPLPADLVMLLVGEQAAAGHIPLWVAVVAFEAIALVGTAVLYLLARGPGHAMVARVGPRVGLTAARLARVTSVIERRGSPALAIGRGTPGLRTLTAVAAGGSGLGPRRALPALVLGSSVFLQLHLVLGYLLGPTARDAIDQARGPAVAVIVLLVLGAAVFWLRRRGRRAAAGEAWAEAACPACLALSLVGQRTLDRLGPSA